MERVVALVGAASLHAPRTMLQSKAHPYTLPQRPSIRNEALRVLNLEVVLWSGLPYVFGGWENSAASVLATIRSSAPPAAPFPRESAITKFESEANVPE